MKKSKTTLSLATMAATTLFFFSTAAAQGVPPRPGHVGENPGSCQAASANLDALIAGADRSCAADRDCFVTNIHPDPCKPPIALSNKARHEFGGKMDEYRIWYSELCMKGTPLNVCMPQAAMPKCVNGQCQAQIMRPPGAGEPLPPSPDFAPTAPRSVR